MHDMIASLAICLSILLIFTPLIGFVIFSRYLSRKEKAVLEQYNEK